jgi:hypothetical protein
MNHKEFATKVLSSPNKEHHKDAFVHLIALHTGNKPDAIRNSLKEKDGFAESKINALHPSVRSEIYKSAITHGNLKGKK